MKPQRSLVVLTIAFFGATVVAQAPVSFVATITVGDSLAAGVRNGVLKEEFQVDAWPSLVARQIGTYHFLPLLPDPGFGQELVLVDGEIVALPPAFGAPGPRALPTLVPQNLAIPGHDVLEALMVRPSLPIDSIEDVILGLPILVVPLGLPPVSQIELAVGLEPTFTMLWLGGNDILQAGVTGADPTPLPVFQQAYTMAVGALLTLTNTRLVVANVPDVDIVPFLVSAEEVAALAGAPLALIGPALGIGAGDFVRLPFAGLVEQILTGQVAGPLPPEAIFPAATVAETRLLVAQMNGFIDVLASQLGFAVVDINRTVREADEAGIPIGDTVVTTAFLGGIFSIDGVHPTKTGQGIIANEFISRINEFFGLSIPLADLEAMLASDPLAPPTVEPASVESSRLSRSAVALSSVEQLLSRGREILSNGEEVSLSREEVWREFLRSQEAPHRARRPSGWSSRGKTGRAP